MSRVIKTETAGKDRAKLIRNVLQAIQELGTQTEVNETTRDLAAYIAISLGAIWQTIDVSVAAWEKRGYWVKADRFRMEWEWTEHLGNKMRQAVLDDDWNAVAIATVQVAEKLKNVKTISRPSKLAPWKGAWQSLCSTKSPQG